MKYRCLVLDDEEISRKFLTHFISKIASLELLAACSSGMEAEKILKRKKTDILFLDVEMPGMSGWQFLDKLPEKPPIILVTSKPGYALKAFDYDVVDYLVKPVSFERFEKAVRKAFKSIDSTQKALERKPLFIKSSSKIIKIDPMEIDFIEAEGDYICIHTGNKKVVHYSTMKDVVEKLNKNDFVRIHRSYIVRLDAITEILHNSVKIGDHEIPIGISYKPLFLEKMKKFDTE